MIRLHRALAFAVLTAVAGCGISVPHIDLNTALTQGAVDSGLIVAALNQDQTRIAAIPGISPAVTAQVGGDAQAMVAVPALLAHASSIAEAQTAVAELARGLNDVFATALSPPTVLPTLVAQDKMEALKTSPFRAAPGSAQKSDAGKFYSPKEEPLTVQKGV